MPIPWMSVLQAIPWAQVIENTPKLVEGAQKLFSRLKKDKPANASRAGNAATTDAAHPAPLEKLLQQQQQDIQTLHQDLRDAADLLQHLTEQNAKLVGEIDTLRLRTRRLQQIMAVVVLVLLAIATHTFMK